MKKKFKENILIIFSLLFWFLLIIIGGLMTKGWY